MYLCRVPFSFLLYTLVNMMLKKISYYFLLLGCLTIASIFFSAVPKAQAVVEPLSGYAWSSNIGWISFNSANPGSGGGSYSVKYDTSNNQLTDYAWSSNIGWISFKSSDLTGCPITPCNARVVGNSLNGWARAISGIGRTDGWDGWISLSGSSPGYGVTKVGAELAGYAWGSDVIGWISFKGGTSPTNGWGVELPGGATFSNIDVYLSDNKGKNVTGGSFTFDYGTTLPISVKWDPQNVVGLTCSATATSGLLKLAVPNSTDLHSAVNNSRELATGLNLVPGTYTFAAECGTGVDKVSDSITLVVAAPVVPQTFSLSANPSSRSANFILSPSSPKTFNSTITLDRGAGFDRKINLTTSTSDADGVTVTLSGSSFVESAGDTPIIATVKVYKDLVTQGTHRVTIHGETETGVPVTADLNINIVVSKSSSSGEI